MTVLGLHTTDDTPGCVPWAVVSPREKFLEFPLKVAVSMAKLLAFTADGALAVKPALLAPAETVTDGGTPTDALPLERATLVALLTAALMYTMQDDVAGGVRLAGGHRRFQTPPPPPAAPHDPPL